MFAPDTIDIRFKPRDYNEGKIKSIEFLRGYQYTDKYNVNWFVPGSYRSDGASIPKWAQKFIGEPLEGDTIRAVGVHDRYCETKEMSQERTHKVFREILKHDGVNLFTRNTMYQAVKWWNKFKNPDWK